MIMKFVKKFERLFERISSYYNGAVATFWQQKISKLK